MSHLLLDLIDQAIAEANATERWDSLAALVKAKAAEARAMKREAGHGARRPTSKPSKVAEARAKAVQAVAAAPVPQGGKGTPRADLTGLVLGPWKVLKIHKAGGSSPTWLVQCTGCTCKRTVIGALLRNKPPRCGGCGKVA